LEYFFGLVELSLPGDEEPGVREPPLSALGGGGGRKVRLREPERVVERGQRRVGTPGGAERERERERRIGTPVMERERERRRSSVQQVPVPTGTPVGGGRRQPQYAPATGYAYVNPY